MRSMTLYCDEFGNTGSNYLDQTQPHYVSAGWLVPSGKRLEFNDAVRALQRDLDVVELKSSKVLNTTTQHEHVRRFLARVILDEVAQPTYVIADKRFCLTGRIVWSLVDPVHNPEAAWLPNAYGNDRQSVWEELDGVLSNDTLQRFQDGWRNRDPGALSDAISHIAADAEAAGLQPRLVRALAYYAGRGSSLLEWEDYDGLEGGHKASVAINGPALKHVMNMTDRLLEGTGKALEVVHDKAIEFEPVYESTVGFMNAVQGADIEVPDGSWIRPFSGCPVSFRSVDSKESLGVQAADVLAGCVGRICQLANGRAKNPQAVREYARLLLPALWDQGPGGRLRMAGTLAHRDLPAKLFLKTGLMEEIVKMADEMHR